MSLPLTFFTASPRLDLARLWLACARRAFPDPDVRFEIYDDSGVSALTPSLLPGADVIGPGPERRDFQEAYNDALSRCATPVLVLADSDVYFTSTDLRPRLEERFRDPAVAAVACVSRRGTQGHGTFATALRTSAYRAALADAPDGFLPAAEAEASGGAPGRWHGHDTGDLLMRAVLARGGRVDDLRLDAGALARFDALTYVHVFRAAAGERALLALAARDPYLREGCLGNLAVRRAYASAFPGGPPFAFPVTRAALWGTLAAAGPAALREGLGRAIRLGAAARRLSRFLPAPRP